MNSTILLVEDSPDDVFFMKRAFRLAGIQAELQVAEDGEKALDYLAGNGVFGRRADFPRPDIVLLDLRLPRVPGFDVLKWMREQDAFHCVPVIVLTSSKEDSDMQQAYALGANSFLVKPSDANELAAMVRALVDYWLRFNAVPSPCTEALP
ncbi:MAG TPA: response regulator [Verrucomicrobiae bacterium]|nr:response regulator [Verrucomicrobiae bacterium]